MSGPAPGELVRGPNGVVPYIASWSAEQTPPATVIATASGVAYADESVLDRDAEGVLWNRVLTRPGVGEPLYGRVHSLRQRHAMHRLLCQVCAQPADRDERGWLWLLPDHREDWPSWPEGMANTHPPLCLRCARISVRTCPYLRPGFVAVRAHSSVAGVGGLIYRSAGWGVQPVRITTVAYGTVAARWMRAGHLVRQLHDCTITTLCG